MSRTGSLTSLDPERGPSPSRASLRSSTAVSESDSLVPDESTFSGMRRRSSVPQRIAALTDFGGHNSVRSFARSWHRAANFPEVLPHRPSLVFAPDHEPLALPEPQYSTPHRDVRPQEWTSLLQQRIEGPQEGPSRWRPSLGPQGDFRERERKALDAEMEAAFRSGSATTDGSRQSIFGMGPGLAEPLVGSYSSHRSYGAIQAELERWSSAASRARGEDDEEEEYSGDELQPILVKEVEQDGKFVLAVEGQSTLPQTVFNSINVLVGVGLLSLPLGIKYAGWVCGMIFLFLCAAVTAYTARLLGKCMDLDPSLITFSDIAYISYGQKARVATSFLFSLELLAANVALIVLFADSMEILFPGLMGATLWKTLCTAILLPLNFLPLRLLSFTSIVGIFSCFGIVAIVVMDGLLKRSAPGSLFEPAATHWFPQRWSTLPLSFGLLLSPWGGHSVFPNIYRDMRHPLKYGKALSVTYVFTSVLDATIAAAGVLMFGDDVREAITSNILRTTGYPTALKALMCAFIAVIPFTKVPLAARPIINTVELVCGVVHHHHHHSDRRRYGEAYRVTVGACARILVLGAFLFVSVVFPSFDSIMAFLGSALCFTICIILPLAFYLRLFRHQVSASERLVAYFLITVSSILSVLGTIWAFLPKSVIGAD